ncbi:MAG: hypothetical protein R3F19_18165 [Verrucomicrobiales bacterium]
MTPNSESRRYHEANAGRDSKPVIFIFEGNNILWMLLGCGLALLVFRLAHGRLNWSIGEALAVGLIPLAISTLYVVLLKSGKPRSFDREFFEWIAVRCRQGLDRAGLMHDRPFFAPPREVGLSQKQPQQKHENTKPSPRMHSHGKTH